MALEPINSGGSQEPPAMGGFTDEMGDTMGTTNSYLYGTWSDGIGYREVHAFASESERDGWASTNGNERAQDFTTRPGACGRTFAFQPVSEADAQHALAIGAVLFSHDGATQVPESDEMWETFSAEDDEDGWDD